MDEIESNLPAPPNNGNMRYNSNHTLIATFNSVEDINDFCNTYNVYNGYGNLKLGQRIKINDGTYNKIWYIAGFDVEYNKIANDGTIYDNGYGIALIPETQLTTSQWNTTKTTVGGYINSYIHKTTLVNITNNLKKVLGEHLIERKVLLSSSVSSSGFEHTDAYIWTNAYCTLMSGAQLTGDVYSHNTEYDNGEANYRLPLFNYMNYKTGFNFWLRGIDSRVCALYVYDTGGIGYDSAGTLGSYGVRPLIYIR